MRVDGGQVAQVEGAALVAGVNLLLIAFVVGLGRAVLLSLRSVVTCTTIAIAAAILVPIPIGSQGIFFLVLG